MGSCVKVGDVGNFKRRLRVNFVKSRFFVT